MAGTRGDVRIGRRAFQAGSTLVLAAGRDPGPAAAAACHYRETLAKLAEAAERFKTEKPAFVAELGDLIDAADAVETERACLKRITTASAAVSTERNSTG